MSGESAGGEQIRTGAAGRGGPLAGVRVVELGRFITAPYAAMLLGDLGADVVKIEAPDGDPFRVWDGGEISPRFLAFNRGKRSVALDLRDEDGRATLDRLVARSDVLIHNFRPASARRMGLVWERLHAVNQRLVLCSISGGGEAGPLADRPMYDQIGQALSGLMSVLGGTATPTPVGPALSDAVTGQFAALGVAAALAERQATGVGRHVTASLLQSTIAFLGEPASHYFATGVPPEPQTRPHQSQSFGFRCADGRPVVIHLSTPTKFWLALLDVVGRPDLAGDPRFGHYNDRVRNYDALEAELAPVFATRDAPDWLEALTAADVPCAPINTMADVFADEQLLSLGVLAELPDGAGGALRAVGRGVWMNGLGPLTRPPALGEHTAEVLAELEGDPP